MKKKKMVMKMMNKRKEVQKSRKLRKKGRKKYLQNLKKIVFHLPKIVKMKNPLRMIMMKILRLICSNKMTLVIKMGNKRKPNNSK